MTVSGRLPWLGWEGDGNEFVYYLMGGYTLLYLICLILTVCNRRTQPSIVLIPPTEDVEDEKTLHKYVLTVHTSQKPGCSFPSGMNLFIQLVGEKEKSHFYKVKVFAADRFLFQKGAVDILLFKTKDFLGPITEVKILVTGEDHLKWKATEMEVFCLTTRKRYTVGYRLLNSGSVAHTHDEVIYLCRPQRKRGHMKSWWMKVVLYHHWFCSASHCVRYGKYTALVNTILLFLSISLIMTGTLVAYIITSYDDGDDVYSLEVTYIAAASVVAALVFIVILSMDLLIRNMKSGNQNVMDDLFPKKSAKHTHSAPDGISPWHNKSEYKFPDLDDKKSLPLPNQSVFKSFVDCADESFLSLDKESKMFESVDDIASRSYVIQQSSIQRPFQSVANVESISPNTARERSQDATVTADIQRPFQSAANVESISPNTAREWSQDATVTADNKKQDDIFSSIISIHITGLKNKDVESFASLTSDSMYAKSAYDWSQSDFRSVIDKSVTGSAEVGDALKTMNRDDESETIIKTEHISVHVDESDLNNERRQQSIQHPSNMCSQKSRADDKTQRVSKPSAGHTTHRSHSKTGSDSQASLQQQRIGQVKAFMKWLLQDMVRAVQDTKQNILTGNKRCGQAGDRVVCWYREMQLQTLLHINHRYQIIKITNKDESTSKYTELKTDFPAVLIKNVMIDVIKRLTRTGRLVEAAEEEINHDTIRQLDMHAEEYLGEHKPTDQCVDVEAEKSSDSSVHIQLTKRETLGEIPTRTSVRTNASSWSWVSSVSTLEPSLVKLPQLEVLVESDSTTVPSSQSHIYVDAKRHLPDDDSIAHSKKKEMTVDQQSLSDSDHTIVCDVEYTCTPGKERREMLTKDDGVSSVIRPCTELGAASDHRYLDCTPYSTSDTTQYNTSQKVLQVLSHVSAPNINYSSKSVSDRPHKHNKHEVNERVIQLKIFFLHQVLKLICMTHSSELSLSELDKMTARLAYLLVKNSVQQECSRLCDLVCKDTGQLDEQLATVSLCHWVVDQAKQELWSEYQDPVLIYSQFLVRQTVLSSLERFEKKFSRKDMTFCMTDVIKTVSKCWHKQGFHSSLNASRNLAQALLSCYINSSMKTSGTPDNVCNNILTLRRLENQLTETLHACAKWLLCLWWSRKQVRRVLSTSKSLDDITDWINVVADVVTQKMVNCLPLAVQNTLIEEVRIFTASSVCQDVICSAVHKVTMESQLRSFPKTLTMDDEVVNMIRANLAPVRGYLKFVTMSENYRSRQRVENCYVQKYQHKHQDFAVVNLQHVVDSFFIRDEENVDNTLTTDVLYELEWHVMHENTKKIPGFFKGWVVFLLFCWILLNTAYTIVTGAHLTVTHIQEWVTSLVICLFVYGLLLEPLCAIVIGSLEEKHRRKSHINERVTTHVTVV